MRLLGFVALAAAVSAPAGLNGNHLLARSVAINRVPKTYAVPIRFAVRLHRPISIRFRTSATSYFKAPDRQALVLMHSAGLVGKLFNRKYPNLDTLPQAWPGEYDVHKVTPLEEDGVEVYRLDAVPKYTGDITRVTFDLVKDGLRPRAAAWYYKDGSTIRLTVVNQVVGGYVLPRREHVSVAMPHLALDATGEMGTYELDRPVPDDVFDPQ
jgi:hypothetical protein